MQKDDNWRILDQEVKKLRDKLKNEYFKKKADAINLASEARDVEEEFRLAKNHTSLNKSKKLLIAPEKLTSHFEQHFSPRPVTLQPEIENPENFPHILPPIITKSMKIFLMKMNFKKSYVSKKIINVKGLIKYILNT